MSRRRKDDNSTIIFWIVALIFIGLTLPFIGIHFILKPETDKKVYGTLMLIGGILFWIFLLVA